MTVHSATLTPNTHFCFPLKKKVKLAQRQQTAWAQNMIMKPVCSPGCSCRHFHCWQTPHWPWWCMSQQPVCCRQAAKPEWSSWRTTTMTTRGSAAEMKSWGLGERSCRRRWTDLERRRRSPLLRCEESLRETDQKTQGDFLFWFPANC